MKLSDIKCSNAKPGINPNKAEDGFTGKPYKMFDGGGLYLEVLPTGGDMGKRLVNLAL